MCGEVAEGGVVGRGLWCAKTRRPWGRGNSIGLLSPSLITPLPPFRFCPQPQLLYTLNSPSTSRKFPT